MKNRKIWLGMLVFGMAVVGCVKAQSNNNNVLNFRGVLLYNPVGTIYTGNGRVEVINGSFEESGLRLGKIGEISPDGKLTMELPDMIPDNFLGYEEGGLKYDFLELPSVFFSDGNSMIRFFYSNGDFHNEESGIVIKKGWNYMLWSYPDGFNYYSKGITSDITGFRWLKYYSPF